MNTILPKERYPQAYNLGLPSFKKVDNPNMSYIVSTYNRPWYLRCVLASLQCQSDTSFEVIVVDNSTDPDIILQNELVVEEFDTRFSYNLIQAKSCYHSSAIGAEQATGKYICFPSDDSYYAPVFQERMMYLLEDGNLDFAYCNMVQNPGYQVCEPTPTYQGMDKTQYVIRRELFDGFAAKDTDCSYADSLTVKALADKRANHWKDSGIYVVHN